MRPEDTLTPAEAQAFLGVPHATFYRMKRKEKLPKPCAWRGRTPLYSRAELAAVKTLRAGGKAPISVDAALTRAHDSAALAVALLVQTQGALTLSKRLWVSLAKLLHGGWTRLTPGTFTYCLNQWRRWHWP
jgi:predicted DNA-binding transcriptional regulator AlpA